MNKFKLKIKNYFLCLKYPFLKPRNRWTDEVPEDYDYSYTEWDAIPEGWNIAFGKEFLKELGKQINKDKLRKSFRIMQIKEKYGTLRFYTNGVTDAVYDIIDKYEKLSEKYCVYCGKSVTHITEGWIEYLCDDCYNRLYKDKKDTLK